VWRTIVYRCIGKLVWAKFLEDTLSEVLHHFNEALVIVETD
jgi:hypothetical protein